MPKFAPLSNRRGAVLHEPSLRNKYNQGVVNLTQSILEF